MTHPPILPRTWACRPGRTRAIGTVLWFMRGIPPRSAMSYISLYKQLVKE